MFKADSLETLVWRRAAHAVPWKGAIVLVYGRSLGYELGWWHTTGWQWKDGGPLSEDVTHLAPLPDAPETIHANE